MKLNAANKQYEKEMSRFSDQLRVSAAEGPKESRPWTRPIA